MISWVDVLLNRWGRWSILVESGALGYSKSSLSSDYCDDGYDSRPPKGIQNEDMEEVSKAVFDLPDDLRIIIIAVYKTQQGKSERKVSNYLGISRYKIKDAINIAHSRISIAISKEIRHNC